MPSTVRVEVPLCSHNAVVQAKDLGDGTVEIAIETDCKSVQTYAELLKTATMEDLTDWKGSKVLACADSAGLTTTCLVPTAVFNCCWVELGLISKALAKDKSPLCLHFVD
jgi:hypothetical protein